MINKSITLWLCLDTVIVVPNGMLMLGRKEFLSQMSSVQNFGGGERSGLELKLLVFLLNTVVSVKAEGLHTVLSDNHSTTWGTLFSQGSQIPQTPRPSFQASVSLYIWGKKH